MICVFDHNPAAEREPLAVRVARHIWPHAFITGVSNREQTERMIEKAQRAIDAVREYDAEEER